MLPSNYQLIVFTAKEWEQRGRLLRPGVKPVRIGAFGTKLYSFEQVDWAINISRQRMLNRTKRTG